MTNFVGKKVYKVISQGVRGVQDILHSTQVYYSRGFNDLAGWDIPSILLE